MNPSRFGDIGNLFLVVAAVVLAGGTFFGALRRFKSRNLSLASKISLPLLKNESALVEVPPPKRQEVPRKKSRKSSGPLPNGGHRPHGRPVDHWRRERLENLLSLTAIAGDFVMIAAGFVLAGLLCQSNLLPGWLQNRPMPSLGESYKLILAGSVIILWGLVGRDLYHYRSLLLPGKIWHKFVEVLGFCLLVLVCFSLILRSEPVTPPVFFGCAVLAVFLNIYNWRMILSQVLRLPVFASRLRRRLVVIGGGSQTRRIQRALADNAGLEFIGWVQANKPNHVTELEECRLGSLHELEVILRRYAINIAVLTESESLQREGVLAVAKACENEYVQFKMVPHFFEILISGLRPENIGGIQLLGVEVLPLHGYRNRVFKRTIDIIGALVGLAVTLPLILIFGALVYRESPGPILYKQIRQGRNGRLFYIYKIRSMRMNAEDQGKAQWAQQDDNRRLRIGTFMRKWNIDEVPQFWNVLRGDMSLVGPRPIIAAEVGKYGSCFACYCSVKSGMTGLWQVSGRSKVTYAERIALDCNYVREWSLWHDVKILAKTVSCFVDTDGAY